MGPLDGIRVLDLTTVVMGPYATQTLGDWGADVITIEDGYSNAVRHMGPAVADGLSGVALNLLRNKRSICLDLKAADGQQIARTLANRSDVLVTNLRPGPLRRLGLSYEVLAAENPKLIFCHAQGWSVDSGDSDRPAYDDIMQAAIGLPFLQQTVTGESALLPTIVVDKVCGLTIAGAVTAALYAREKRGVGQRVEVPMFDTALAFTLVEHLAAATTGLGPAGYSRILAPSRRIYRTLDGWLLVFPYTTKHWTQLCEAVGRHDLALDERFATPTARSANANEMYGLVGTMLASRTTAEWIEFCTRADIPHHEAHSLAAIVDDPTLHRGVIQSAEHPDAGTYAHIAPPVRFSGSPLAEEPRPAPRPGADTDAILVELGYAPSEIEQFHAAQVVR
jgi:crotonobetainyl-CoA:carnitine CoA-transferase CaiB-like acyl-CoA transferase